MSRRFEEAYKIIRGMNLGDPETWNRRCDDVDRRLHETELSSGKIDAAVDVMIQIALSRLNDTFAPIIQEAIDRLEEIGVLFAAESDSELIIGLGTKFVTLTDGTRHSWVVPDHVSLRATENQDHGLVGRVIAYTRETGVLEVDSLIVFNGGTFTGWQIKMAGDPAVEHASRTDNPHSVTAAQTGAYTEAQTDDAIADAIAAVDIDTTGLAPLNSPAFTGNPTAPTQAPSNNSTRLATTEFVQALFAAFTALGVSNAALSDMASKTIKMRAASGPGDPEDVAYATAVNELRATTEQIWTGTAGSVLTPDDIVTAKAPHGVVVGAPAGIQPNCATDGTNWVVTMNADRDVTAPAGITPFVGSSITFLVKQDGVGNRKLVNWNGVYKWGAEGKPTLSTAANAADLLTFYVAASNQIIFLGIRKGVQ